MDLPPDKAKLLKNYDYEKKWDIICDQVNTINCNSTKTTYLNDFIVGKIRHKHSVIFWVKLK